MTIIKESDWLEGLDAELDALGQPRTRRHSPHWDRVWADFVKGLEPLRSAPEARVLWERVIREWDSFTPEDRLEAATALTLQAVVLAPRLTTTFGPGGFASCVVKLIDMIVPVHQGGAARDLWPALIFADETWKTLLWYHSREEFAAEVTTGNRLHEAPLPELRRRLRDEGKPLHEIDELIERWAREFRDADRSYELPRRGRPAGATERKPRQLPEARRQRYQAALDQPQAVWAAIHEPALTDQICWEELADKYRRAQKLARRHGLEKTPGS